MQNTKAAIALVVSVLIAGMTAANTQVHDHTALTVLTIALAGINPVWVWATSNTKTSTPTDAHGQPLP